MAPSVPSLPDQVRVVLKAVICAFANAVVIDGNDAALLLAILKLENA